MIAPEKLSVEASRLVYPVTKPVCDHQRTPRSPTVRNTPPPMRGSTGCPRSMLWHTASSARTARANRARQRVLGAGGRGGSAGQNAEHSGDRLVRGGALAPAAAHAGHVGEQIADGDRRLPLAYPRQPPRRQHLVDVRVQVQAAPGGQ